MEFIAQANTDVLFNYNDMKLRIVQKIILKIQKYLMNKSLVARHITYFEFVSFDNIIFTSIVYRYVAYL